MKVLSYTGVLIMLLSTFVLSCKKDSDTSSSSPSTGNSSGGVSSTSSATARYAQNCTLEDYSATWCEWCPGTKVTTDAAVAAYGNRIIPMEFHPDDRPDDLTFAGTTQLARAFYASGGGYPMQLINRNISPSSAIGAAGLLGPLSLNLIMPSQMAPLITTPSTPAISSTVGLAISSSLNSNASVLSIVVKCRSAQAISGTKFVVYVLESGVISPLHINSFSGDATFSNPNGILYPLFTAPNPIYNYVNNHVVRASVTNLFGDPIPDQVVASEYIKTYTVNLTPTWNSNNLGIVFMAVRLDNSLINAQGAAVGQLQDFQIIVP